MNKTKQIILVIGAVVALYAVISVFIVFVSDTSISVNADLAAAHNMSQYPGTLDFLLASPWILYVAPAVIGVAVIIVILKGESIAEAISEIRRRRL